MSSLRPSLEICTICPTTQDGTWQGIAGEAVLLAFRSGDYTTLLETKLAQPSPWDQLSAMGRKQGCSLNSTLSASPHKMVPSLQAVSSFLLLVRPLESAALFPLIDAPNYSVRLEGLNLQFTS